MKVFLSLLMLYSFSYALFDSERYVNGSYDDNLKIVWMYSKADNKDGGLQRKFGKALNNTANKLRDSFDNITSTQMKKYHSLISIMEDSSIYANKEKLFNSDMLSLYDHNVNTQLVVAFKVEKVEKNHYRLFGIKLFKDGKKTIATTHEVNKKVSIISQETLENMAYFFIKSSIDDYQSVNRSGSDPIITFADNKEDKLKVEIFKAQEVKKFSTYVENQDFELAASLNLISSENKNQKTAQEYCEVLGMMLINKNFAMDDIDNQYFYEMLYEKYSFKDGWIVYKKTNPSDVEGKNFKCIDAKDSIMSISADEYELNQIGLKYRLNNKEVYHSKKIVAVDIQSEESFDGSDTIYTSVIDNDGLLSIWENGDMASKKETDIKDTKAITLSDAITDITIENTQKIVKYKINSGKIDDKSSGDAESKVDRSGLYIIGKVSNDTLTATIDANKELVFNGTTNKLDYWPTTISIIDNKLAVGARGRIYIYSFTNNQINTNETIEHNDFSGDVSKILFFKNGEYYVVATTQSELVFYKKGEPNSIKKISNFGYSINDISISKNEKYLVAANGDETVYIYELDVIINSTISDKGDK